jgi:dUTP pyrophosphatase
MIEIKRIGEWVRVPEYATEDSAGIDLIANIDKPLSLRAGSKAELVPTGFAINMQTIPEDIMAIIVPRSGNGHKRGLVLGNTIGIIDQDYHGQLMVSAWNRNSEDEIIIIPGERIAQLIFVPIYKPVFKVVEDFSSDTARGAGGFGSTGV